MVMRRLVAIALTVPLLAAPAFATTMVALDTPDLYRAADAVALVRIGDVHAEQTGGHVTTFADLEVAEAFKGATAGAHVRALSPGGTVGHIGSQVGGAPTLVSGTTCVVFLEKVAPDVYRFVGLEQGKLDVTTSDAGMAGVRRNHTAALLRRTPTGELRPSAPLPEVEPLDAYLHELRVLAEGAR